MVIKTKENLYEILSSYFQEHFRADICFLHLAIVLKVMTYGATVLGYVTRTEIMNLQIS